MEKECVWMNKKQAWNKKDSKGKKIHPRGPSKQNLWVLHDRWSDMQHDLPLSSPTFAQRQGALDWATWRASLIARALARYGYAGCLSNADSKWWGTACYSSTARCFPGVFPRCSCAEKVRDVEVQCYVRLKGQGGLGRKESLQHPEVLVASTDHM